MSCRPGGRPVSRLPGETRKEIMAVSVAGVKCAAGAVFSALLASR